MFNRIEGGYLFLYLSCYFFEIFDFRVGSLMKVFACRKIPEFYRTFLKHVLFASSTLKMYLCFRSNKYIF